MKAVLSMAFVLGVCGLAGAADSRPRSDVNASNENRRAEADVPLTIKKTGKNSPVHELA